jgi:hypothetical protein
VLNLFKFLKKITKCGGFSFLFNTMFANGRGYEQLRVACAMGRIAYSLCYVGAMGF